MLKRGTKVFRQECAGWVVDPPHGDESWTQGAYSWVDFGTGPEMCYNPDLAVKEDGLSRLAVVVSLLIGIGIGVVIRAQW